MAERVSTLEEAPELIAVQVRAPSHTFADPTTMSELQRILKNYPGETEVTFRVQTDEGEQVMKPRRRLARVDPARPARRAGELAGARPRSADARGRAGSQAGDRDEHQLRRRQVERSGGRGAGCAELGVGGAVGDRQQPPLVS